MPERSESATGQLKQIIEAEEDLGVTIDEQRLGRFVTRRAGAWR